MGEEILKIKDVCKSFPGVNALINVCFNLKQGEIHGLVGENGAGKSTLIKILSGVYPKDSGKIFLNKKLIEIKDPYHAQLLGISTIHQELMLIPTLTVSENIFLGRLSYKNNLFIDWNSVKNKTEKVFEMLNININPNAVVSDLSPAQQQLVAIAKALSMKSKIFIMDEPTSALSEDETQKLFRIMLQLKANGVGIIFITHRVQEVFKMADRITVLRDGKNRGTMDKKDTSPSKVVELMVGREISDYFSKKETKIGELILKVSGLNKKGVLRDVSFELHKGEILGFAGLVGSGRTELAQTIFGSSHKDSGEVLIYGNPINPKNPQQMISVGVGLVPEERKTQGLVLGMSVYENISLANLKSIQKFGIIIKSREKKSANYYSKSLDIKSRGIGQKVESLSGGNQQKVVLAKWLAAKSKILILDEPTRGIDVGAKAEIHSLIVELAKQGVGIMLISSELPEVLAMSDRVLVMREGRLVANLLRKDVSEEIVMNLAVGVEEPKV